MNKQFVTKKKALLSNALHKNTFKQSQLMVEVERILHSILAGEVSDPVLNSLNLYFVEPIGNSNSLLIVVGHDEWPEKIDATEVEQRLQRAQGYLRTLVAQSLNRKKVPLLKFKYIGIMPAQANEEDDNANYENY